MRYIFVLFILSVLIHSSFAQKFGIGASAMYNFQTESFGFGIRGEIPKNRFSIVPQFSYYPAFNKIHEYYVGIGFNINMFTFNRWTLYATIHPGYNAWLNYENSAMSKAKRSNFDLEGGLGIKTGLCLKPFLEYRYNIHWRETHLQLGFVYFFGCKKGKTSGIPGTKGKVKRKKGTCSAYD
ncbi:MAG: hypothetical protein N2449_06055 [Bacteroidales bacterium]|nr:hypothetical protein [Bacteroidales bacterium]